MLYIPDTRGKEKHNLSGWGNGGPLGQRNHQRGRYKGYKSEKTLPQASEEESEKAFSRDKAKEKRGF